MADSMADRYRNHHRHHHDPELAEVPVPHGPETDSDSEPDAGAMPASEEERQRIFGYLTRPDDLYTPEGVYWADLPLAQRWKFVSSVSAAETRREAGASWRMFKADPLAPVGWYMRNAVIPGAGLLLEGYVLFSIGNLEPLFAAAWPQCWGSHATECSRNWVASVTYLEILGIMIGQIGVGIIGDWLGRRWGLIQDAAIMLFGLILLTAGWGTSLQAWVIFYGWSLFIYGLGVGGEYPVTATSSMENAVGAGKVSTKDDRLHRGRKVTMAFLMQGWGQFFNQLTLIVLLFIFNRVGTPPYSEEATQLTFRLSFGFPALGTLWLLYYRFYRMRHASKQLQDAKKRSRVTGYDIQSMKLTFKHFGGRLIATAGTWFCNDVFFYGNKLFQGQFIKVISDNPKSVMETWRWNMVNITVALAGYYAAALLIDNKMYGRKTMQTVGFTVCFITFVIPAFGFSYFTSPAGIHAFQAMYFLSSFFNQFGPNAVTFLIAGEVYPTQIRASAHGFSACIGKSGALLASVLYNYIDTQTKFYVVPWFGLAGLLLNEVFMPDTTGLDLKEQERRWRQILRGQPEAYHGIAVHPRHLSLWERLRGVGKSYDPAADLDSKLHDIRADWELNEQDKEHRRARGEPVSDAEDEFTDEVHSFFRQASGDEDPVEKEKQQEKAGGRGEAEQKEMGQRHETASGAEEGRQGSGEK